MKGRQKGGIVNFSLQNKNSSSISCVIEKIIVLLHSIFDTASAREYKREKST